MASYSLEPQRSVSKFFDLLDSGKHLRSLQLTVRGYKYYDLGAVEKALKAFRGLKVNGTVTIAGWYTDEWYGEEVSDEHKAEVIRAISQDTSD